MEPDTFWDAAFGGKNNLILSFDAHTFRVRRNKHSVTYSFVYDTNKSVRIRQEPSWLMDEPDQYVVYGLVDGKIDSSWIAPAIEYVSGMVEEATGYALHPFDR